VPVSGDLARNISLYLGDVDAGAIDRSVTKVLAGRPPPAAPVRLWQRLMMKAGRLSFEHSWLEPLLAVRRTILGDRAAGAPRFLVRVDEFPYYTAYDRPQDIEMSRRFHEIMVNAGVAHLMSVVPQLTHAPLTVGSTGGRPLGEQEIELLEQMRGDGVTFAQHGTTHRTRFGRPSRRSEFCRLSLEQTERKLERGRERLALAGVESPRVFVPPFNRFDASQYRLLAARFAVICGGPESVALMGFHGGPLWLNDAVYMPCYAPLYADARTILPAVERLIDLAPGVWIPVVLHTSWERDEGFGALAELAARIAPFAARWDEFLAEVDRSAEATATLSV
jgi:hypothetical protein